MSIPLNTRIRRTIALLSASLVAGTLLAADTGEMTEVSLPGAPRVQRVQLLHAPPSRSIYKEFSRTNRSDNTWRVTDPDARAVGLPGNAPVDFLPNPGLPIQIDDLQGAIRAEIVIDVWGSHVGTTDKRLRLNGGHGFRSPS